MPGFSSEARKSAALARKIKHRFGMGAYELYRKTGAVPAGLNEKPPVRASTVARQAASAVGSSPSVQAKIKEATDRLNASSTKIDAKEAKIAQALPNLSAPEILTALARQQKKSDRSRYEQIAKAQAKDALPDKAFVKHFQDTKIFTRRGDPPQFVKQVRDKLHNGDRVPLYAVPAGTRVALFRDANSPAPDLIATVTGHIERKPEGLSKTVPYVQFQDSEGKNYEYPALLGGGDKSPQAQYSSFAAIGPILKGQSYIPTLGWGFPNFASGPDAGSSDAPEGIDKLAKAIQRAVSFQQAVERRKTGSNLTDVNQINNELDKQRGRLAKVKPESPAWYSATHRVEALEKRLTEIEGSKN